MLTKKLLPYMAMALSMYFASCQKDALVDDSSLNSETISSEATIDNTIETKPAVWTSYVTSINSNVGGFWQGVPALYNQTTKKYPLIIFIHGIGELGTSLSKLNCCGLPYHLSRKTFPANFNVNGQNFSFITIAPQFKRRPSAAEVQSVIDFAKRRFRVDASRVYVTGLSMGGGSTWDWSAVYGQNAAAIVPVCGGTAPSTSLSQKIAAKSLPFWALYSTKDALVPASWGTNFFKWVTQFNSAIAGKTKLTIWTDVDHNGTWARAFNPNTKIDGRNIYQWLLLYTRGASSGAIPTNPAKPGSGNAAPVAKAGDDQVVPASWNWFPQLNGSLSADSDGWITKSTWSQISGPNSVKLTTVSTFKAKITGWKPGVYVFRLTIQDNNGATSYDDVSINISGTASGPSSPSNPSPNNKPAVANAGRDQSIPKSWKWFPSINASLSRDADGWISKFAWSQVSGPNQAKIGSPNSSVAKLNGLTVGSYIFRIAVTDNSNAVSYDDVKITVTNN